MVANKHTHDALQAWAKSLAPGEWTVFVAPRFVKWLYKRYDRPVPRAPFDDYVKIEAGPGVVLHVNAMDHCAKFDAGTYIFTKISLADEGELRVVRTREATDGFITDDELETDERLASFTKLVHYLTDELRAPNLFLLLINSEAVVWRFNDPNLAFEFKNAFNVG